MSPKSFRSAWSSNRKSQRPAAKGQSGNSRRRRFLSTEALEGRLVLTALVADVLAGTVDTAIVGTVYEDLNSNAIKDNGEDGVLGWTAYLDLDNSGTLNTDAVGTLEPSAITNVDGDYVINHLVPGNYRVAEVVPTGWTPTSPVSQDVTVKQSKDTRANFFNFSGGEITGTVWNDLSVPPDGVRAGSPGAYTEPGLANWTVFLDLNNNHALDAAEPSTLTGTDGSYDFTNLPPGDYEVTEILPAGWDVSPTFDIKQTATVVARQQAVQDFANFSTSNGSIQGTIWNDSNANGIRETDPTTGAFTEPGLDAWTVYLDLNNNLAADGGEPTALTDADGNYSFISVPAGDYEVTEVLPSAWNVSPTYDIRQTVTVFGGTVSIAQDFANFTILNGSIRGAVWNDVNRNGLRDVNALTGAFLDPGLANWTVFLDLNRNRINDLSEPSTLTDTNGGYAFTNLQVGDYDVQEILPSGWEASTTFSDSQTVTVFSGVESLAHDFANFDVAASAPGSVSGVVWNDNNGNGLRDAGDSGLPGWTVFVDTNADGALGPGEPQATSAANGSYSISGVSSGSVSIFVQPTVGWRATAPVTNSRSIALKSGENAVGLDFGEAALKDSSISGVVFADTNKNGTRNVGERGLAGITVYLDLNGNSLLDVGEPEAQTSADLYYTPAVDEAGTYSFTHLAQGTYAIREILPTVLSSTPAGEREHVVTIGPAEDHTGVNFAAVFRPNEIHGTLFDDANGNHQRDAGEAGIGGVTIFVDLNRNNSLDAGEPTTITLADGSYSFTNMSPGAYVVREVVSAGYTQTSPTTIGGILWPSGVSNPAVGNVSPLNITTSLAVGETYLQTVSITLPTTGALTNLVDVFLLFDDTGSFVNNSPIVRAAFPDIISQLQTSLSGIDLGFGVGRFEEYGNFASEYSTGRPFVLNQPIVAAGTSGYMTAIQSALNRTTPGYGGDQPETDIEALYQLVSGQGFDGNNNGTVLDSGAAGLASTQLNPGGSGDVPSFASFAADPAHSVMPAAGNIGGAGFRAGALPIVLLATDTGFAYQPKGETSVTGVGGLTLPVSSLTQTSRPTTPYNSGAGFQQTITGLNALGALVIGLGTNPQATLDPRQGLESISKLTGATNQSTTTIANGTADPIAPGDPLYFQIASGFGPSVANGVVSAIQNAVTNVAVDVSVQASDPRVHIINHPAVIHGVGAGQTATFDIEFQGDGIPHRFDLQFVRAGTNVVLGSIPVVIGTPVPGDCYEFEDLEDGDIGSGVDFGNTATGSTIAGSQIFYNNSFYDDPSNDPGNLNDDTAIATDKSAYLPGSGTSSFANYTTYDKGINGIMVDFTPGGNHAALSVADFAFKMSAQGISGQSSDPTDGSWNTPVPAPTVVYRTAGTAVPAQLGYAGNVLPYDRIELVWPDSTIVDRWLEVIVKANANTGLAAQDVFFYGNMPGDTNDDPSGDFKTIDANDQFNIKTAATDPSNTGLYFTYSLSTAISNLWDVNRDGDVNANDQFAAKQYSLSPYGELDTINISSGGPFAPASSGVIDATTGGVSALLDPIGIASHTDALFGNLRQVGNNGALASALSLAMNGLRSEVSVLTWLPDSLQDVVLSGGELVSYADVLAKADSPRDKTILAESNRMSDNQWLDDELLDELLSSRLE